MIRRPSILLSRSITCKELDSLSQGNGQLGYRPRTQPVIDSDMSAGWYLQDRFDYRWKDGNIPGLDYKNYTGVRRGIWDVFQKLRFKKLAGDRVYFVVLQLCQKLNFRSDVAEKLLLHADSDGVVITSEMIELLVRLAVGKNGGIGVITSILRSKDFEKQSLSPKIITSIISSLRNWIPPIKALECSVALTQQLLSSAVPYQFMISCCDNSIDALAIFNIAKCNEIIPNSVYYTTLLNVSIRSRDRLSAIKIFNSIPQKYRQSVHYERLLSVYRETDSETLLERVFNEIALDQSAVSVQHLLPTITHYGLSANSSITKQLYCSHLTDYVRDDWSILGSIMSAFSVTADTTAADMLWESRPTNKKPLGLLQRYKSTYEVALLNAKYGEMPVIGCVNAIMSEKISYAVLHRALLFLYESSKKRVSGKPFGLQACLRRLQSVREETNTGERSGRHARSDYGDLHSIQLTKLFAMSAELQQSPSSIKELLFKNNPYSDTSSTRDISTQFGLALQDSDLLEFFNNSSTYKKHITESIEEFGSNLYNIPTDDVTSQIPISSHEKATPLENKIKTNNPIEDVNTNQAVKSEDSFLIDDSSFKEDDKLLLLERTQPGNSIKKNSPAAVKRLTTIIDGMLQKKKKIEINKDDRNLEKYLYKAWNTQTGKDWNNVTSE